MPVIRNERLRKTLRYIIPFVLIPAAVLCGAFIFRGKSYSYVSLAVALMAILLFITGFEKKKTGTRRLILVCVLTALSVVGRFIPVFKPVTAITIIAALYFGSEAGFLVGSLSAVISNFFFGQGPWTPFQMLSWGLIGFLAGALSLPLRRSRVFLLAFGAFTGVMYSMIMDIWTVLWYNESFDISLYSAALVTAVPYTVIYAVSNVVFLSVMSKPFGEKLERLKIRYGV